LAGLGNVPRQFKLEKLMEIKRNSSWISAFSSQKARRTPTNKKIVHEGRTYYSVGATARILSTTPKKVKEMMGRGDLEWTQFRDNGPLFVTADSIVGYQKRQQDGIADGFAAGHRASD
jgi:hypothetical protein